MAAKTCHSSFSKPSPFRYSSKSQIPNPKFTLPLPPRSLKPVHHRSLLILNPISPMMSITALSAMPDDVASTTDDFPSRFAADEPRKGADILVEALERQGVAYVFGHSGGPSMEIHQAISRSNIIGIVPSYGRGGVFAAEGYARSSGLPGVCIATSGAGATNIVTGLADALLDSVPLVAITVEVPRRMIGQGNPIVEVTRPISKHTYLVLDVDDIPRIVKEAFFLATSGRPGPVLIHVPNDIQQQFAIPNWDQPLRLSGYMSRLPKAPDESHLEQIVRLISEAKKPVLYVGGGCVNSSEELRRFVELTGIPVASTLMGLGTFPCIDALSLHMLGMHGTVYANYAVDKSDLLLAFGVRFNDYVTGKLEAFASRAKIVHIDIDSAEIGKNKQPHVSVCADVKLALDGINKILESKGSKLNLDYSAWRADLNEQKLKYPLVYETFGETIPSQYAIQVLDELTGGNAIISTGVGHHQVCAAQFYKYQRPRQLLTSSGLGDMGFGLSAAIGAAVANPGALVVDIDGDGSLNINAEDLATIRLGNLPIKILLLNSEHLEVPDILDLAKGYRIPAARVTKKEEVRAALKTMLETTGPYILEIMALLMIPHWWGY